MVQKQFIFNPSLEKTICWQSVNEVSPPPAKIKGFSLLCNFHVRNVIVKNHSN